MQILFDHGKDILLSHFFFALKKYYRSSTFITKTKVIPVLFLYNLLLHLEFLYYSDL